MIICSNCKISNKTVWKK